MFACLYLPPRANSSIVDRRSSIVDRPSSIVQLARDFSPRVETHDDRTVTLDISGLGSLIGEPRAIGEELRRTAADAGLRVHIAVAATTTAAVVLAHARAGLTVVPRGGEAAALAPLPLRILTILGYGLLAVDQGTPPKAPGRAPDVEQLARWGLRTLGDLGALPSAELSARLGRAGIRLQRWARGEEMRPLVPAVVEEPFDAALDLEWPIANLEPLSFVLSRLLDPLCDRLERGDRGAVVLRLTLTLVTRERHERVIELPAPMRDARVLRTLALLDLESNPPPAAVDRVAVAVDATEGRVLQFGLFARALPADTLATLVARLGALMGSDRIGSPALVDTYRPGAFTMTKFHPQPFDAPAAAAESRIANQGRSASVLRRFRSPIPARVAVEQGRPVRVATDRRGIAGGRVERCEGPWRSSGNWWSPSTLDAGRWTMDDGRSTMDDRRWTMDDRRSWNCDEWEVWLSDGATYRISQAHDAGAWFVNGLLD
jgi:protein ImuB